MFKMKTAVFLLQTKTYVFSSDKNSAFLIYKMAATKIIDITNPSANRFYLRID